MPICMHGLDVSFMKKNPLPEHMKYKPRREEPNAARSNLPSPYYMADIKPFVSPVGENPSLISSRKHLRDHERAYDMYQVGDDIKPGEIAAKNEAKRAAREELAKGVENGWGDIE